MPDLILSSPEKRARKTAIAVTKAIGYPKKKIRYTLRERLGVRVYVKIHAGIVRHAHALDLLDPKLPMLPKNRRKGLTVVATIQAYCSTNGKQQ